MTGRYKGLRLETSRVLLSEGDSIKGFFFQKLTDIRGLDAFDIRLRSQNNCQVLVMNLIDEVSSRSRRFYSRQARGLKIHIALPPIHPEELYTPGRQASAN